MKNILVLLLILICSTAQAQCVAEIKDVKIDEQRGSIIVETEYKLNGVVVQVGNTRYTEESGTNEEIIARTKADVKEHCQNLIRRIENNAKFMNEEMLKAQIALTEPVKTDISDDLIGYKETVSEAIQTYKGKTITVKSDEKNSVSNIVAVQ